MILVLHDVRKTTMHIYALGRLQKTHFVVGGLSSPKETLLAAVEAGIRSGKLLANICSAFALFGVRYLVDYE